MSKSLHVVAQNRLECASDFYFSVKDTLGGKSTLSKSLHVVAEDRLECASGFYFPVKDILGGRSIFSKSLHVDTDLHVYMSIEWVLFSATRVSTLPGAGRRVLLVDIWK